MADTITRIQPLPIRRETFHPFRAEISCKLWEAVVGSRVLHNEYPCWASPQTYKKVKQKKCDVSQMVSEITVPTLECGYSQRH